MNRYLDKEMLRQTDAQTSVQTNRYTERQLLKQIGIQTYRKIETRFMHKQKENILRADIQTQIDRQRNELMERQMASKCI